MEPSLKKKLSCGWVGCAGYVVGCAGYVVRVAQAMWWVAQAMWSGLRRLCGGPSQKIMPLRGSILQVGTCQILSLAENPRWSRVWQQVSKPDMEFHMINITYAALHMRAQTEKTTFLCKDD